MSKAWAKDKKRFVGTSRSAVSPALGRLREQLQKSDSEKRREYFTDFRKCFRKSIAGEGFVLGKNGILYNVGTTWVSACHFTRLMLFLEATMKNFFNKLFGQLSGEDPSNRNPEYSADLEKLTVAMSHLPEKEAIYLAGFALLLARVAHLDFKISDDERQRIQHVLLSISGLSEDHAALVTNLAIERTELHSLESHIIFRRLNETLSVDRKKDLIRGLLRVASVEDITEHESDEIGFIAKALNLSRQIFLELRSEFRDHIAILKSLPDPSKKKNP
ncbi:MAG: TerB family tellurite resistance protein [Bdellovibrionota bacterium]